MAKIKKGFNVNQMKPQNFGLPKTIFNYFLKKVNGQVMRKLFISCKYFYSRNPYCIVDEIDDQKIKVGYKWFSTLMLPCIENIWVLNSLRFYTYLKSPFVKKIVRCQTKSIYMRVGKLPIHLFYLLTQSTELTYWNAEPTSIINNDGNYITLDELLIRLPKTDFIGAFVQGIPDHADTLIPPSQVNRIKRFHFGIINHKINPRACYNFFKIALVPKASIELAFICSSNIEATSKESQIRQFRREIKSHLKEWLPANEKPTLNMYLLIKKGV